MATQKYSKTFAKLKSVAGSQLINLLAQDQCRINKHATKEKPGKEK